MRVKLLVPTHARRQWPTTCAALHAQTALSLAADQATASRNVQRNVVSGARTRPEWLALWALRMPNDTPQSQADTGIDATSLSILEGAC